MLSDKSTYSQQGQELDDLHHDLELLERITHDVAQLRLPYEVREVYTL